MTDEKPFVNPTPQHPPTTNHICGWARVNGVWTCVQDYYAVGFRPDTGCGKTWFPTPAKP